LRSAITEIKLVEISNHFKTSEKKGVLGPLSPSKILWYVYFMSRVKDRLFESG
jgi:hypothetical protein